MNSFDLNYNHAQSRVEELEGSVVIRNSVGLCNSKAPASASKRQHAPAGDMRACDQ